MGGGSGFTGMGSNTLLGGLFSSNEGSPFSYEKQRNEQESSVRPDPETEKINALKRQQIQDILKVTGGYKGLFGSESDKLFQLSPQAQQMLNRYTRQASRQGLTPEQWYADTQKAIDPTAQTNAARDILNQIVTPQMQNRYGQMGLGRSGALGESLTMAGTQMALPIAQMAQQQRFEIERQRPNIDVTLRKANLARSEQAFAASDFQRRLDLANWQRKVGGMTSALGMVPYVAGQDSKGVSRQFGNILTDLIDMAIGAIGAIYGGGGGESRQPQTLQPQAIGGNAPMGTGGFGGGSGDASLVPSTGSPVAYQSYMTPSPFQMYT